MIDLTLEEIEKLRENPAFLYVELHTDLREALINSLPVDQNWEESGAWVSKNGMKCETVRSTSIEDDFCGWFYGYLFDNESLKNLFVLKFVK